MQGGLENGGPVGIRFYSHFLCLLPEGGDAFQMQMTIFWGGNSLGLDLLDLPWSILQVPVSVNSLTAVRNREEEVC
jgi:hypothetical protein